MLTTDEIARRKPVGRTRRAARRATAATRSPPPPGATSLNIIDDEQLVENVARVGAALLARAPHLRRPLSVRRPRARSAGSSSASSSFATKRTKEPLSKAACRRIFDEALARGLLTMAYSPHFRLQPALTLDEATARNGLEALREVFDTIERDGSWSI